MKQTLNATRMITMGLFTLCTMAISHSALATVKAEGPIELKFIGQVEKQPVFQLSLNNDEAEEYFITVRNADYDVIFSEKIKGINLSRKYQLALDEGDLASSEFGVSIQVTSAKTHKTETFKVKATSHFIENYEVAKL